MKKLLITILLVFSHQYIFSQRLEVEVNGTNVTLSDQHITSDFGRRESGSKFHDGIDFSASGLDGELNGDFITLRVTQRGL